LLPFWPPFRPDRVVEMEGANTQLRIVGLAPRIVVFAQLALSVETECAIPPKEKLLATVPSTAVPAASMALADKTRMRPLSTALKTVLLSC